MTYLEKMETSIEFFKIINFLESGELQLTDLPKNDVDTFLYYAEQEANK